MKPALPAAIAILGMLATTTWGETVPPQQAGDAGVMVDLKDADVRDALRMLAIQTGVSISFADRVKGRVTAELRDVTLEQALDRILKPLGCTWRKTGEGYLVSPLRPGEVGQVPRPGIPPRPATSPRRAAGNLVWESVGLRHVSADGFVSLLRGDGRRLGDPQFDPPVELPEGIEVIGAYNPLNAVLVRGEAGAVEGLKALLKAVDTEERPVLVRLRLRALLKEAAARLPMGPLGEELVAAQVVWPKLLEALTAAGAQPVGQRLVAVAPGGHTQTSLAVAGKEDDTIHATAGVSVTVDERALDPFKVTVDLAASAKPVKEETDTAGTGAAVRQGLRTTLELAPDSIGIIAGTWDRDGAAVKLVPLAFPGDPERALVWLVETRRLPLREKR
jgi:hypothetical protein